MKKRAFTMIELIFSIIIVGLVILSIPLIVRQSSANNIMSQNVLGYYNALTLIDTIRKKPWDSNNIDDFLKSGEYYILQTGNAATDCKILDTQANAHILTKKGLANANRRRMCDPQSRTASPIVYNARLAAINDFQGYTTKVVSNGNDIFQLSTSISYANIDFGNGTNAGSLTLTNNTTDVKAINVTLSRLDPQNPNSPETIAIFTYYAANIGYDIPFVKDNREAVNGNN